MDFSQTDQIYSKEAAQHETWKRKTAFLLQNLCEEFEFEIAQFFKVVREWGKKPYLSCKNQPFHAEENIDKEQLKFFLDITRKTKIEKDGNGLLQTCWDTGHYVWSTNVQFLSSDDYLRKFSAIETGVQTCLIVPYTIDGKFEGCIEFFSMEEWAEIPELVKKLLHYTTTKSEKDLNV